MTETETHTEKHILSLDYLDAEVHIEPDGEVFIHFVPVDGPRLKVDSRDLARIVGFAETHGDITLASRDGE